MSNSNGSITVTEIANKGRSLLSCRSLKAGEIILKDSPLLLYSAVPHRSPAANYCSHCFRSLPPHSVPCPNSCPNSLFCSTKCQSVALSTSHTPFVCQLLARLFASDSPLLQQHEDLHLQARFLVSAYNLAVTSPSSFQTLLSLQGESINDDATVVLLHSLISSMCPSINSSSFGFSVQLTGALLAKDKLNGFGLMEPFDPSKERSVRAYGVYPMASFFNHDCLPNACRFDYVDAVVPDSSNVDITVRVIHDLPEGREICVSYFPVTLKYAERQRRLREDYGFICDCDRCKVEANWSDEEDEEEMGEEEDEDMEEDVENGGGSDIGAEDVGMVGENDDFPHAYFFASYMCNRDNCGGTLAPLPPSGAAPSTVMECNFCGNLTNSEDMVEGNGKMQ